MTTPIDFILQPPPVPEWTGPATQVSFEVPEDSQEEEDAPVVVAPKPSRRPVVEKHKPDGKYSADLYKSASNEKWG